MNYFELYNIPVQLTIDKASLHKKFIELSKKYHPDYFAQEGDEKQAEVLEISASLNKAYKIFQHTDATIKYVLQQKELLAEEEKYQLPPAFLMEVMDINEQLMEAEMNDDTEKNKQLETAISQLSIEIYDPVKEIVEHYQEGITTEKELLQVKEYYFKKKYLDRISGQLKGKP